MGSEFSYEDLASQEVEQFTYKYLQDEPHEDRQAYVVERKPQNKYSGYSRQVVWYDQEDYRIWKIMFYDRKGSLLKTLTYQDYNQYLDHYWRPGKMLMENHQTGKSTELVFEDYRFRTGLTQADFKKNDLKRVN